MTVKETTEDHDSCLCGARKRTGGTCGRPAGWGTDHAGYGTCKLHGGAMRNHRIAAQKSIASEAVKVFGLDLEVDPRDALLAEVHRTAGAIDWLREQIQVLDPTEVTDSPWIPLYRQERKHLIDVCRAAISAGIEERRVRLAEQQGTLLADVIRGILGDLDLTPDQAARVSEVVPQRLRALVDVA